MIRLLINEKEKNFERLTKSDYIGWEKEREKMLAFEKHALNFNWKIIFKLV